ncbi:BrnA antitoxin family protein [Candidatus Methylospira mobilis]|uniref:BrnA antitoxin family protein n=1 Tax=Candidatus Methylospira mobilis TaxID=1808979 RepID=UPI00387EE56A
MQFPGPELLQSSTNTTLVGCIPAKPTGISKSAEGWQTRMNDALKEWLREHAA